MHADAIASADVDGNPANGYEIVVGGNHAAMFDWRQASSSGRTTTQSKTSKWGSASTWPTRRALEVVLLDRIGPRTSTGHDANVLLSSTDKLLWKESRKDYGWITVTENMNNWDATALTLSCPITAAGNPGHPVRRGSEGDRPNSPIAATWSTTRNTPIFAATAKKSVIV